jgi:PAS domain S-box-containing protein
VSLYVLVPLLSCVALAFFAGAVLTRDACGPVNRLAALLVGCAGFWALCESVWQAQSEPAAALRWVRISALGSVWIGPLALHVMVALHPEPLPRLRRTLPLLYAAAALFVSVVWLTPWILSGVVRTSWGWAYELGPGYPLLHGFSVANFVAALSVGWCAQRRAPSSGERSQLRWLTASILVPLFVASVTDGLLPVASVQLPRLGIVSFAVLGAMVAWSFHRYGYSLLAPGNFASEILEALPDGVAMLGLDGRIRTVNAAMARLLGDERDRLVGVSMAERLDCGAGQPTDDAPQRHCELVTASGGREPVSISSAALRDRRGAAVGGVMVVRDLREVVSLRNRLLLSGRLAAVGELAAGIAHEINNPLAYVRANLSLLRQHWEALGARVEKTDGSDESTELLAEGEELIEESLEGVARAADIVRDVRGLAHAGRRQWEVASLDALIDGVLRMAAPQLRDHVRLEKCYAPTPPIFCAPQELQQVFLNLVLNAGQSIGCSGTLRIVTEPDGDGVTVRFEDDGCGIAPDVLSRIFDPFFTTKPVGKGTGLGLGIAYEIVRRHGGEITVQSEVGRGSCFSVHLPVDADTIDAG